MPRHSMAIAASAFCLLLSAASAATTSPTAGPAAAPRSPLPVPSAVDQTAVDKLLQELFRSEYAKKTAPDRRALAVKFLQQARETRDNPAARYVLLREARDLATNAADADTAMRAIDDLAIAFLVDSTDEMRVHALGLIQPMLTEPPALEGLARHALVAIDRAVIAGNYDAARRLLAIAEAAAARSKKVPLAARVQESARELAGLLQDHDRCTKARAVLRQNPDDPDARTTVGRTVCFLQSNFDAGLPLLAECADPALKALARQDLAAAKGPICDPRAQFPLAGAWWDLAQSQPRLAKSHIEARAGYWYQRALPQLTGLDRAAALSRIGSAAPDPALLARLSPGLVAEVHSGSAFELKLLTRIDPDVNFDWGKDGPGDGLPKDDFSIRWTGWLTIDKPGRYTFVLHANSGARLIIDGDTLIERDRYTSRNGVRQVADLAEGPHALRLEFWDTGGAAKMIPQWIPPGAKDPVPVPPDALHHEPNPSLAAELAKPRK